MTITYELNSEDIKKLIAAEYGVKIDSIRMEAYGPSQDGPYYSPGGCFFKFEVKNAEKRWER